MVIHLKTQVQMTHLYALVQMELNAQAILDKCAVVYMVETIILAFIVCETIRDFVFMFLIGKR